MGEQPNPWDLLSLDATSRHRVPNLAVDNGLLGKISLLSPGTFYPLNDTFHKQCQSLVPTFVPARPVGLQSSSLVRALDTRLPTRLGASVTFWEATAPVKPAPDAVTVGSRLDTQFDQVFQQRHQHWRASF